MKCVYLEKSDMGATLSTWFYCSMWQLYTAHKMGLIGYVNWPQHLSLTPHQDHMAFSRCPNMFEWYCEQPQWVGPGVPPRDGTWLWETSTETGAHCLMGQPLAVIKDWYHKNLLFNVAVNSRATELTKKYNFEFSNTLAITWRGCDSYTDGRPKMPIETYYPFIDDILEKEPNLKIFATAEETTIVETLQQRYPQIFTVSEFFSAPRGYTGHSEYVNPASGYERGMQTCCLIYILSKCKYYIKNRSSMGMVASWLSDGHIVCLAHPENGGYGFDITKAEIDGKIVPLNR
jgi:hypothetical protein